ncbi:hypothetical protein ACFW6V_28360 [Streptomyces sp. NPDC058734]|uniref:hypothetical protein n=1 Tax=Streptomyces sp. NPDC058734 TaxID=3346615 RepID=UPI0036AC7B95
MRKTGRIGATLAAVVAMAAFGAGQAQAADGPLLGLLSPLLCGVQNNVNGSNNQFNQATSCQQTATTTPPTSTGFTDYEIVENEFTVGVGGAFGDTVACPAGKKVTGGGLTSPAFSASAVDLYQSGPTPDGTSWVIRGANTSGAPLTVNTYAICANVDA